MKYKVIFQTYVTEYDIDPQVIAKGDAWIEDDRLKMRITEGDPYFVYNCVKDSTIQESIEKRSKKIYRSGHVLTNLIQVYISRTPELFVKEPLDTSVAPPKYRFSSSSRITAVDETGLEPARSRMLHDLLNIFDAEDNDFWMMDEQ